MTVPPRTADHPVPFIGSTRQKHYSLGALRDGIAHKICNFALRRIATPWYRTWIDGSIEYGLRAAARDADELRPLPPDYRTR